MLSLQEISDRLEIMDLLVSYGHAIDRRELDALDAVFTADAVIDYTELGGSRGGVEDTKAFLTLALAHFSAYQHLVATTRLTVDGDTATGRTICHNPVVLDTGDGDTHVFFCGLWHLDTFVRTADGWRIKERHEEKCFFHNLPTDFPRPG